MQHRIVVAISSDILPMGPLVGLYAAVTRKGMSGQVYGEDEKITMQEAICAYTLAGAYLTFEESIKGSIEPGKLADMVVLSEDLLTLNPDRIMEVEVETTILNDKVVYQR